MAQPPFLVDELQIEPGSGDTITLSRDSTDGAMKFVDAVLTSGVLLPDLVGLRNVTGVYVVGRAGDGAAYTSIQDALDAVPDSSSAAAPSLIMILPGVYTENVTIQKDGAYLVGLGGVTLTNNGVSDTVEISAAITTTPQDVLLRGLKIQNTSGGRSCVRILGADSFASGTVTVNAAPLATGDTITINGTALTGTAGVRTSGSNDFSVSSMTSDGIAAEIVAAINDTANSFATLVEAEAAFNVVTLTAVTAGSAGNAITLVSATTPPGGMTAPVSGLLAGGGSAGSLVGNGVITIDDCELLAAGAAGYQVRADTSGHIRVRGGTWRGGDNASLSTASNCALFSVAGVEWANDFEVAYDTTLDRPADTTCEYEILSVGRINGVLSNLSGAGSLAIKNCPVMATMSQDGDQAFNAYLSNLGALTLNGTTAATLYGSTRTTATQAGGSPTLAEPHIRSEVVFTASTSETITFDVPGPDVNYTVLVENPSPTGTLAIRNKTATEFRIEATPALTETVGYSIVRSL
ncbi:MAG: hypothetical protein CMJ67_10390 [Planctomycetaceae bacterium]|nr:hypothetical protein [Planctomycetaceae bacterium]